MTESAGMFCAVRIGILFTFLCVWIKNILLNLCSVFFCFSSQGWYIVTYALGIYLLNLFIAFLTPKIDPAVLDDSDGELCSLWQQLLQLFVSVLHYGSWCSLLPPGLPGWKSGSMSWIFSAWRKTVLKRDPRTSRRESSKARVCAAKSWHWLTLFLAGTVH